MAGKYYSSWPLVVKCVLLLQMFALLGKLDTSLQKTCLFLLFSIFGVVLSTTALVFIHPCGQATLEENVCFQEERSINFHLLEIPRTGI